MESSTNPRVLTSITQILHYERPYIEGYTGSGLGQDRWRKGMIQRKAAKQAWVGGGGNRTRIICAILGLDVAVHVEGQ
jgi:hypothetical protein